MLKHACGSQPKQPKQSKGRKGDKRAWHGILATCAQGAGGHSNLTLHSIAPFKTTWQGECRNAGKVILAAVPAESMCVYMFEIDDEVGWLAGWWLFSCKWRWVW